MTPLSFTSNVGAVALGRFPEARRRRARLFGRVEHGATDDIGYHAAEDRMDIHDFHATVLHLLGLDH
jgi:hypothetical protein